MSVLLPETAAEEMAVVIAVMLDVGGQPLPSDAALMELAQRELDGAGVEGSCEELVSAILATERAQDALSDGRSEEEAVALVLGHLVEDAAARGLTFADGRRPWLT